MLSSTGCSPRQALSIACLLPCCHTILCRPTAGEKPINRGSEAELLLQVDLPIDHGDSLLCEHLLLELEPSAKPGQRTIRPHDAMTRHGWGIGVAVQRISDCAIRLGPQCPCDLAVRCHLPTRNPRTHGPHLLVEGHGVAYASGLDVVFEHGRILYSRQWDRHYGLCFGL